MIGKRHLPVTQPTLRPCTATLPGSRRLAELLAQTVHGVSLAANAEECTLTVGALLQHFAAREDLPAQLLCRPGQEYLGLDEAFLEKRPDRGVQLRDIGLAARTHYHALGILRTQCRFPRPLRRRLADTVDLVEDADARHRLRTDLPQHFIRHRDLPFKSGIARIDDVDEQRRFDRLLERRLERRDE